MIFSIEKSLVLVQLKKQLSSLFIMTNEQDNILDKYFDKVLERCEYCFQLTPNKYFSRDGETFFSPYISTQYTIFLYYFANTVYKLEPEQNELCDKLYYLNKSLNALDIYFAVDLPDFFMCEHPVGSVMGRAIYGEGFFFMQGCTVGGAGNRGFEVYPHIGKNVQMYANSMILGNSHVSDNVMVGGGCIIKNQDIPPNSIVFGESPYLVIKPRK